MKAHRRPRLTEGRVSELSFRHKEYAQFKIARALAYLIDKDKSARLKALTCSYCFYFNSGSLAGQAFTEWTCEVCEKDQMHSNTGVPIACDACAKRHSLCKECGSDLHGRCRRKGSLPEAT